VKLELELEAPARSSDEEGPPGGGPSRFIPPPPRRYQSSVPVPLECWPQDDLKPVGKLVP
jgi:hypothetical protein